MNSRHTLLTLSAELLEQILRKAWCAETCAPSVRRFWDKDNPAWGQCAVTALLVQDFFGGSLLRYEVYNYGSHYCNLVEGTKIDLTRSQFPPDVELKPAMLRFTNLRKHILYSEKAKEAETLERYQLLLERMVTAGKETVTLLKDLEYANDPRSSL